MVLSVNLKDAVVSLPVNLLPRGVPHCALPLYKAALVFFLPTSWSKCLPDGTCRSSPASYT